MYPCENCLKLYKYPKSLETHQKTCKNHRCEYCDKTFTHRTSYYRHRKICTNNPNKKPKEENMMKQMMELLKHSIDNQKGNITNIDNSKNVHINITAFGKEKPLEISQEEWCQLAYNRNIITELYKRKNIDIKKNRNFYVKDLKRSEVYYYEDDQWKAKNKKDALIELFFNQIQEIDDARMKYDFTKDQSHDHHITIENKLAFLTDDLCDKQDKEQKELERCAFNNRHIIKEVYDKT